MASSILIRSVRCRSMICSMRGSCVAYFRYISRGTSPSGAEKNSSVALDSSVPMGYSYP